MSRATINGVRIAGVSTTVPPGFVDNATSNLGFDAEDVRKVTAMAGVGRRHVVARGQTATDLCIDAAERLLRRLGWTKESVDALILVTQSPDYFLPSSACVAHRWLGLSTECAAFDVGLGCSGFPYGLYLASAMVRSGGHERVLLLHGETPSRFVDPKDHATTLLFGDAGSAAALERSEGRDSHFVMHSDGAGSDGLIIRGGAFRDREPDNSRHLALEMDGAAIFNFTIKRVPPLIREILALAGRTVDQIDHFVFHQSNRFIMKHLIKRCGLAEQRVPMTIEDTANCGGPSVAVTLTRRVQVPPGASVAIMLVGYGVGLSWASAVVELDADAPLLHAESDARHGAEA